MWQCWRSDTFCLPVHILVLKICVMCIQLHVSRGEWPQRCKDQDDKIWAAEELCTAEERTSLYVLSGAQRLASWFLLWMLKYFAGIVLKSRVQYSKDIVDKYVIQIDRDETHLTSSSLTNIQILLCFESPYRIASHSSFRWNWFAFWIWDFAWKTHHRRGVRCMWHRGWLGAKKRVDAWI